MFRAENARLLHVLCEPIADMMIAAIVIKRTWQQSVALYVRWHESDAKESISEKRCVKTNSTELIT